MAEWLAPFHAPKFTTEEFEDLKAKYVAKYGYTVTIPQAEDIIHLRAFKPLTEEETAMWKAREYDKIPPDRLADIKKEKAAKKRKFLAMMGDPSPKIARNAAAILTSLDDIQDAVSTLACIGMIAAAVIGGPVAAAVLGPLGLILGASQVLNLVNPMSQFSRLMKGTATGRPPKRLMERLLGKNPFTKKSKLKLARRLKKFKPSVGNALEALQVTDNIFGVGISLGPIMGFVQGAISGTIRSALGQKVTLKTSGPAPNRAEVAAAKALRAVVALNGYGWHSDASDETNTIIAASWAMATLYPSLEEYNPLEEIEDLGSYLVECPQPTDVLTREILEEEGIDPDNACVWPQNGQRWISIGELQETTAEQATVNLRHYAEENNHTLEAFTALAAADDFAGNFLAAIEGPEQIITGHSHIERIVFNILEAGFQYPPDITPEQVQKFEEWCYVHEYMDTQPRRKDIQHYAETFCGFSWLKSPNEFLGDG